MMIIYRHVCICQSIYESFFGHAFQHESSDSPTDSLIYLPTPLSTHSHSAAPPSLPASPLSPRHTEVCVSICVCIVHPSIHLRVYLSA
mmetsp:Transcript_33977/g.97880  ORF Transcript_33977/g.97880 Transcript_33977/m.97880 type:complete len:88 (+) Transcript_33977:1272-1535(+)